MNMEIFIEAPKLISDKNLLNIKAQTVTYVHRLVSKLVNN